MPNTDWEKTIDDMVDKNTKAWFTVYSNEEAVYLAGDTLVRDHDYFFVLTVFNCGTEVRFSQLQARCTTKKCPNVVFYTDGTYSTPTNRVHLNWSDVASGEWKTGRVYFRVTKDMKDKPITHYGVYGVVVPEGHTWHTLKWDANRGPQ